jgi:hypothetical protein
MSRICAGASAIPGPPVRSGHRSTPPPNGGTRSAWSHARSPSTVAGNTFRSPSSSGRAVDASAGSGYADSTGITSRSRASRTGSTPAIGTRATRPKRRGSCVRRGSGSSDCVASARRRSIETSSRSRCSAGSDSSRRAGSGRRSACGGNAWTWSCSACFGASSCLAASLSPPGEGQPRSLERSTIPVRAAIRRRRSARDRRAPGVGALPARSTGRRRSFRRPRPGRSSAPARPQRAASPRPLRPGGLQG